MTTSLASCYASVRATVANVLAPIDPARAYVLAPTNGDIAARYAQQLFSTRLTSDTRSPVADLAKRALLRDATAVDALTVLAFQAELRGENEKANALFNYSTALSRRELRSRIWAIEAAVNRGDIAQALFNYDIALRTSREAGLLLFPSLGRAVVEPKIRVFLLPILAAGPPWKDNFFGYIATHRIEPEGLAKLLAEGRGRGVTAPVPVQVQVIDALFLAGKAEEAWSVYQSLRGNVARTSSRDPAFSLAGTQPSVFDWRVGDDTRLGVAILNDSGRGAIDFSVPPGAGGVLATQAQLLPPGTYRLEGRSRGIKQSPGSQPYWALTCSDIREFGRVPVSSSDADNGRFGGVFTVPQNCAVQSLQLLARPSDAITGVSGQITEARLRPVR